MSVLTIADIVSQKSCSEKYERFLFNFTKSTCINLSLTDNDKLNQPICPEKLQTEFVFNVILFFNLSLSVKNTLFKLFLANFDSNWSKKFQISHD